MAHLFHKAAHLIIPVAAVKKGCSHYKRYANREDDEQHIAVALYVAGKHFGIICQVVINTVRLQYVSHERNNEEAQNIESALSHYGSYHFMGRQFFILGQYGTFGYFSCPGQGQVSDISYKDREGSIDNRRPHFHSFQQVAPAQGTEKMRKKASGKDGDQVPGINAFDSAYEFLLLLIIQLMEHVINYPNTQTQKNHVLQYGEQGFLHNTKGNKVQ